MTNKIEMPRTVEASYICGQLPFFSVCMQSTWRDMLSKSEKQDHNEEKELARTGQIALHDTVRMYRKVLTCRRT